VKGLRSYVASAGRPTKCTPELTEKICEYLASGCYVCTACDLCGIDQSTYHRWRERGENGEEPYCEFVKAIKDAEARAEARAVALVQKAMVDDWKAAMTWMERKFPDRWSRGERREISGSINQTVIIPVHGPDDPLADEEPDGSDISE